jgi:hypothetical protein
MTLHPIHLNFLIYEENFIFLFISVRFMQNIYFTAKQYIAYCFQAMDAKILLNNLFKKEYNAFTTVF